MDDRRYLDLVEAAKAGDTFSFGELDRRHGPRLRAWPAKWSVPMAPRT